MSQSPDQNTRLIIHADGGSRNNPGPAALAYVICDQHNRPLERRGEYIGETTNNVAEYKALIAAARRAAQLGSQSVEFRIDSELIQRQVAGQYRVKSPHLKPLFRELMAELRRIPAWTVRHVPREENTTADLLVNQAIDVRGVVT